MADRSSDDSIEGEGADALPDLWSSTTYGTSIPCTVAHPAPGIAVETGDIQVKDR